MTIRELVSELSSTGEWIIAVLFIILAIGIIQFTCPRKPNKKIWED